MPELPDVQLFKEYFDATSLHKEISEVAHCTAKLLEDLSCKELARHLQGKSFTETIRHGKYLFAKMDDTDVLILHFGMTGFLRSFKEDNKEQEQKHSRLCIAFKDGYQLSYNCRRKLGRISLCTNIDDYLKKKNLGPDALALCADKERFTERLQGRRGTLKGQLMNQGLLAGIGNIYTDEILFQENHHPRKKCSELTEDQLGGLAKAAKRILLKAIETRAGEKGWPRSWLLPRREAGSNCPRCSGKIEKISVSGRSTYFCAEHQTK